MCVYCLGLNVLMTCICILAVDFRVFPRSFAKTETFGVSLMDVGVGTYIISSALTSKYARGVNTTSRSASHSNTFTADDSSWDNLTGQSENNKNNNYAVSVYFFLFIVE